MKHLKRFNEGFMSGLKSAVGIKSDNERIVDDACKKSGLIYKKISDTEYMTIPKNGHEIFIRFKHGDWEGQKTFNVFVTPQYYGTPGDEKQVDVHLDEYLMDYDFNSKPNVTHKYSISDKSNESITNDGWKPLYKKWLSSPFTIYKIKRKNEKLTHYDLLTMFKRELESKGEWNSEWTESHEIYSKNETNEDLNESSGFIISLAAWYLYDALSKIPKDQWAQYIMENTKEMFADFVEFLSKYGYPIDIEVLKGKIDNIFRLALGKLYKEGGVWQRKQISK